MTKDSPLQFKGTTLQIIHVALRTAVIDTLRQALDEMTGNTPDFFENEPALLDFSNASDLPATLDWEGIRTLFANSGLRVVASLGLPENLATAASAAGLPPINAEALARPVRPATKPETAAADPAPVVPAPAPQAIKAATQIIDKPLRSGQRIYAQGGDLIVLAMVSAGAEVIADGNIHIYAPLRGRALAGANGDRQARIFTTCLEAELISVAGIYRTFETGVPAALASQPATVGLVEHNDELRLDVAPLALR